MRSTISCPNGIADKKLPLHSTSQLFTCGLIRLLVANLSPEIAREEVDHLG